jgi:hypothetical protein
MPQSASPAGRIAKHVSVETATSPQTVTAAVVISIPVPVVPSVTIEARLDAARDCLAKVQPDSDYPKEAIRLIDESLALLRGKRWRRWAHSCDIGLQYCGPMLYLAMITAVEVIFIELYCRWHGARFLSLHLYDDANISKLAGIDFVGMQSGSSPPTMSIVAEVLMWSSLGIWAFRAFTMLARYKNERINPPHDITDYASVLIRNTSIAAVIITLLALARFQVFDQSVENFQAVAGLAFILGFFGDQAYGILNTIAQKVFAMMGSQDPSPSRTRPRKREKKRSD